MTSENHSLEPGKRVLLVIDRFWPCLAGAEIQATRMIRALRERGYEFAVLTSKLRVLPDFDDFEGTPVYRLPFYAAFEDRDVAAIHRIRRRVAEIATDFNADLVHLNGFGPTVFFVKEMRGAGTPMLFEISGPSRRATAGRHWRTRCARPTA